MYPSGGIEQPIQTQHGAPAWAEFFDAEWYDKRYPDVSESGLAPIEHFIRQGAAEFRDPNPAFDTDWYPRAYPDIAGAGVAPFEHFVRFGAAEGRLPFRGFDLYLQSIGSAHGSNLEAYRQYLAQRPQPGIPRTVWGAAADAEIRCLKEPSFDGELALFVTYSPDGWLKPHVRHIVDSLRREGIAVALIVNTDMAWKFRDSDLMSCVDSLFVRQNKGFDFAAWAHVLQLRPETREATILYLINDSLVGPIDQTKVAEILRRIRASKADVIGLTENRERGWHLQSYFLAFKPSALHSTPFVSIIERIVCYEDKLDVIADYELRFATDFRRAGLNCEPIFRAQDARNPTTHHWKQLIDSGFPFVKAELFQDAEFNADGGPQFLSAMGFDIRLAERLRADLEPADTEPSEPQVTPPSIRPVVNHWPGETTFGFATSLSAVPWQPPVEQMRSAADQAKHRYTSAKLGLIHSRGGELLAEFRAAMSMWAAGATDGASAESLICAAGISPGCEPPAAAEENLPTPILRRYREAQIATTRRFRVDHRRVGTSNGPITFSILVPMFKTPLIYLERALLSVICQTYRQWELCVVDNGSGESDVAAALDYYQSLDRQIHVTRISQNAGISAATNIALDMATGEYVGLLDADDLLTRDTLENVSDRLTKDPSIDLLYTDECKIDEDDIVHELMPKPDWTRYH